MYKFLQAMLLPSKPKIKTKIAIYYPDGAHVPPRVGEHAYTCIDVHTDRYWINDNARLVHFSTATPMRTSGDVYHYHGTVTNCAGQAR